MRDYKYQLKIELEDGLEIEVEFESEVDEEHKVEFVREWRLISANKDFEYWSNNLQDLEDDVIYECEKYIKHLNEVLRGF